MPTIRVTVLHDGEPVSGHRVALEVSGIDGGMTRPEQTDSQGVAEFDVEFGQKGDVSIEGSWEGHWGSYSAEDVTVSL